MSSKHVLFRAEAREKILRGVTALADAVRSADALVLVTEWKLFRSPAFARIRAALREPVLLDGRNLYQPAAVEQAGLAYYGIGRGRSVQSAAPVAVSTDAPHVHVAATV